MSQPVDSALLAHLAKVVESSDDAIVSKDLNGIIRTWNRAAEKMFGYTAREAKGQSIRMIIPENRQGEEDVVLAKVRAGETVDHFETQRQRKDGTLLWISLTVSPIRDDDGQIVGASKIARDISDAVRLRALAREHLTVMEKLNEVGALVASSLDREAIVQKVTDVATELTTAQFGAFFYNMRRPDSGESYMLYTLSGAPKEAFANFPQPRATAIFAPTFHGEGTLRLDDVTQDPRYGQNAPNRGMPPGHLPVRSYLAVPVKGVSGEVLGGLFFGHAEVGVFTSQHERFAEGVAAWASVALENARLYVEANEASRMKDEFLALLSHELRTPLSAIVGYVRLLRGGLITGEQAAQGLETVDRNAKWLSQIIEDVLDVSRIISGKLRLNVQAVSLPLIIDNAIATVKPAADAKGVRLQTIIDPLVGPVSGDPDRLQQVVWNLLTNAVKFTAKGGRVQVRLERVNSHIEIIVSDTGAGIRPDFLPYVFERFRQADSGLTRKSGGLGLGLAIVRHIVEMHGGTVDAASDGEGKGSTFRIVLPLMIVHGQTREERIHPRSEHIAALTSLADLRGIKVLATDDEPDALEMVRVVLATAGAEVIIKSSPRELLAEIGQIRPDVLLIDIGMPEMDGFSVIQQIRGSTDPRVKHVPAAALTAFARSEDRTRVLRSGFEMHLAKPIDPGELVAAVATLSRRPKLQNN